MKDKSYSTPILHKKKIKFKTKKPDKNSNFRLNSSTTNLCKHHHI